MIGNEQARALRAEYLHIKAIQSALRATMERKADNWKMEYIAKRKELSIAFGKLSQISSELLPRIIDKKIVIDFQNTLSQVRHATALHQASWPVVTIENSKSEYLKSLSNLENVNADFHAAADQLIRWAEVNLAKIDQ